MSTTSVSSGSLATGSTTTLLTGKATLNSVQLIGDGTNAPTVIIYDNTAGSGKIIARLSAPTTGVFTAFTPAVSIRCDIGLTVVVSGTGASAIIGYGAT